MPIRFIHTGTVVTKEFGELGGETRRLDEFFPKEELTPVESRCPPPPIVWPRLRPGRVSKAQVLEAIEKAKQKFPEEWQAQLLEIALIPAVSEGIRNRNPLGFQLKRASHPKWGEGYVLEGWNSVRDEYFAHNPSTTWDGIRRNYYGASAIEVLRTWGLLGTPPKDNESLKRLGLVAVEITSVEKRKAKWWVVTFFDKARVKTFIFEVQAWDNEHVKQRMQEIAKEKGLEVQHWEPFREHPIPRAGIGAIFLPESRMFDASDIA